MTVSACLRLAGRRLAIAGLRFGGLRLADWRVGGRRSEIGGLADCRIGGSGVGGRRLADWRIVGLAGRGSEVGGRRSEIGGLADCGRFGAGAGGIKARRGFMTTGRGRAGRQRPQLVYHLRKARRAGFPVSRLNSPRIIIPTPVICCPPAGGNYGQRPRVRVNGGCCPPAGGNYSSSSDGGRLRCRNISASGIASPGSSGVVKISPDDNTARVP